MWPDCFLIIHRLPDALVIIITAFCNPFVTDVYWYMLAITTKDGCLWCSPHCGHCLLVPPVLVTQPAECSALHRPTALPSAISSPLSFIQRYAPGLFAAPPCFWILLPMVNETHIRQMVRPGFGNFPVSILHVASCHHRLVDALELIMLLTVRANS